MSKIRKLRVGALAAVLAAATTVTFGGASPAKAQLGPAFAQGEYATQGYFATLLVDKMKVNVRQTWTPENAIQSLSDIGIEPLDGWSADETLTEGTMVFLLRFVDIPIYTADPEREVTVLEARSILKKYERHFLTNVEVFTMHDGQTFTTVDEWTMEHPSN
jgi:hypothetical protein